METLQQPIETRLTQHVNTVICSFWNQLYMINLREQVQTIFKEQFARDPELVIKAPGRINLIGEHTDYNGGYVLPAAVDKAIYMAFGRAAGTQGTWLAPQLNSTVHINFGNVQPIAAGWANYILGVAAQFIKTELTVPAFDCVVLSDIPIGGGMSSSAALTAAAATAINNIQGHGLGKLQLAKFCQLSEHEYAGVNCGIMDMFASLFGKEEHVMLLDCRSLEYEYFPLHIPGYELVLFDSNVKHALTTGEYNIRRQYCEEGISILKRYFPQVQLLRDVDMDMLLQHRAELPPHVYDCCCYVVEEIRRTLGACEDLRKNDIAALGKKMFATHAGLRDQYKVSCPELDFLVGAVSDDPRVAGSRMMGGGFGGCSINLIREDAVTDIFSQLQRAYHAHTGLELKMYAVRASDGAHTV